MSASHGSVELPPTPRHRAITPAPADFRRRLTIGQALWPLLWFGAATLLVNQLAAWGWPLFVHASH